MIADSQLLSAPVTLQSVLCEAEITGTQWLEQQDSLVSQEDITDLLQLQEGLDEIHRLQQLPPSPPDLSSLNLPAEQEIGLETAVIQAAAIAPSPATLLPLVLITAKTNYACLNVALALQKSGLKPSDFKLVVSRMYLLAHKQAYMGPVKRYLTSPAQLVKDISKGKLPLLQVRQSVIVA